MSPEERDRRLAELAGVCRVWGGKADGPGDVTPGLIDLCREWIKPTDLMAEVGCCRGVSTRVFACFARFVWAIDPWTMASAMGYIDISAGDLLEAEAEFALHAAEYPNILPVRDFSTNAVQRFPFGSLDAVYLDGAHDLGPFCADVRAWLLRLKPGGLLMGHDFDKVGKFFAWMNLPPPTRTYPETSWVLKMEDIPWTSL